MDALDSLLLETKRMTFSARQKWNPIKHESRRLTGNPLESFSTKRVGSQQGKNTREMYWPFERSLMYLKNKSIAAQ
jgi:hypothetical protein